MPGSMRENEVPPGTSALAAREAELYRLNEQLDSKKNKAVRLAQAAVLEVGEAAARVGAFRVEAETHEIGSESEVLSQSSAQPTAGATVMYSCPSSTPQLDGKSTPAQHAAALDASPLPTEPAQEVPLSEEGLGPEGTVRLLRAKLKVMTEELEKTVRELGDKETELLKERAGAAELREKLAKSAKTAESSRSQIERYKKLADERQAQLEGQERQMSSLLKEKDGALKQQRQIESDVSSKDLRLNRALEEVEKYKTMLKEAKAEQREVIDAGRRANEQLSADNKKLTKQKNELLVAFKKQLKLIDILKRQKMHMEAAKLLSFTEEEFSQTLELGEKV
jgi:hypothetical protein